MQFTLDSVFNATKEVAKVSALTRECVCGGGGGGGGEQEEY